eukprot:2066246-Pleurochrysis_carterae.AAC.2
MIRLLVATTRTLVALHPSALASLKTHRRGEDVCYYQNHIRRRNGFYYTCSFTLYVEHSDDVLYLAYCHPFTLTDLKVYINRLEADPSASRRFRRRPLCLSLAGNPIELLTITSFPAEPSELARRKVRRGCCKNGRFAKR